MAAAGKDFDRYGQWLRKNGLATDGIRIVGEEFTAGAYITTDMADNQITGFNPGAMKHPSRFPFAQYGAGDSLAVIAPGCIEDMNSYSRTFKRLGIPYIFDPGQSIPALSGDQMADMITGARMLISNDYELEMIHKSTGLTEKQILDRTPVVITTLGEKGSVVKTAEGETMIPAVAAERVVDPTGAGDAYRAGLIKGMVSGEALTTAARMGAVCAGYAVAHKGTQAHRFTFAAFRARYAEVFEG